VRREKGTGTFIIDDSPRLINVPVPFSFLTQPDISGQVGREGKSLLRFQSCQPLGECFEARGLEITAGCDPLRCPSAPLIWALSAGGGRTRFHYRRGITC
jgi:hypothetical protein